MNPVPSSTHHQSDEGTDDADSPLVTFGHAIGAAWALLVGVGLLMTGTGLQTETAPAGRRLTVLQLLPALESGGVEKSTLEIAEATTIHRGTSKIVPGKGNVNRFRNVRFCGAKLIECA